MSVRAGILLGPVAILWFCKGRDAVLPACPLMHPTSRLGSLLYKSFVKALTWGQSKQVETLTNIYSTYYVASHMLDNSCHYTCPLKFQRVYQKEITRSVSNQSIN